MEYLQDLMSTEIWNGRSLSELVTLEFLISAAGNIVSATLIVLAAFIVSAWVAGRIRKLAQRHRRLDDTLFSFLANLVRYVILAFAALFILNTFGIQTTSVVAVIGAAGLAIGLALQGTLSNVAAGVMIILFRPIKLGDFVVINDKMGSRRRKDHPRHDHGRPAQPRPARAVLSGEQPQRVFGGFSGAGLVRQL